MSKFQLDPSITGFKAEFTKVAITEGDHAGSTAIVLKTTSSASAAPELPVQRWTAAQGGVWSDVANWADGKKAVMAATFVAPGAADVPVTLDETPELRALAVEGETAGRGYRFTGTKPLALASDESVPSVESVSPGVNSLTFDVPVTSDSTIVLSNGFGSTVAFGNDFASRGTVRVNTQKFSRGAAGEVTFGGDVTMGGLEVTAGRVTIPSLAWVRAASDVTIVNGTLAYTGSGETIAGLSLKNGKTTCSVLDVANDLTLLSIPNTDPGPFLKTGDGVLRFKGTNEFHCGKNNMLFAPSNTTDSVVAPNGDGPVNTLANFSVAAGKVIVGTTGDSADAPQVIVSSQMAVGLHAGEGASPELILNNGSVTTQKNALRIGYCDTLGASETTPTVTVNGGLLSLANDLIMADSDSNGASRQTCSPTLTINGGDVVVGRSVMMGRSATDPSATTKSTITVNGGTLTANDFTLGYANSASVRTTDCTVNLNGGVTTVKTTLKMSRNAMTESVVNLNAGAVLKVGSITSDRTGGTFRFNGGTLVLTGTAQDANTEFLVGAGGAIVSTEGAANGVAELLVTLKHDPALGAAPDGGLVKRGPGVLVIPADCTFTGPIVVEEGSVVKGGVSGDEGNVVLAANSVIECFTAPGMWDAGVLKVEGNLSANGPVYVDFGRTAENPIRLGERYPLALVGGELVGRLRFRAVNAGDNLQLQTVFEDGVLMVEVVRRGLMIVIR